MLPEEVIRTLRETRGRLGYMRCLATALEVGHCENKSAENLMQSILSLILGSNIKQNDVKEVNRTSLYFSQQ